MILLLRNLLLAIFSAQIRATPAHCRLGQLEKARNARFTSSLSVDRLQEIVLVSTLGLPYSQLALGLT